MLVLVVVATVFCIPPIVMAVCMKDIRLDGRFSAVGGDLAPNGPEVSTMKKQESTLVDEENIEKSRF